MHTHGVENGNGVAGATKKLADHAVALGKLELKLALLELKEKAAAFGLGAGLLVGAAVFAVFALGFLLAASAAALAIVLATWLALNKPLGLVGLLVPLCVLWLSYDEQTARAAEARLFAELARGQEEAQGRSIVHLQLGEPDFDTPANVRAAAKAALDAGATHYPPFAGIPALLG